MLCLILVLSNQLYGQKFFWDHRQPRQMMSGAVFSTRRIGPRGFLAPMGVVSTSTLSELLWDFLRAVRFRSAVCVMLTVLAGGQKQGSSSWNCKLQVSDNIPEESNVVWSLRVIKTLLWWLHWLFNHVFIIQNACFYNRFHWKTENKVVFRIIVSLIIVLCYLIDRL